MLLFRGLNGATVPYGFGAIDPATIQSTEGKLGPKPGESGSIVNAPITALDPLNPPKQVTRATIRAMGDIYRVWVSLRGQEIQAQVSQLVQTCVNGKSTLDPSIQEACDNWLGPERLRLPIGVLDMLGVMFAVSELQNVGEDGKLEKAYTPDPEQRFLASWSAYATSQVALASLMGVGPQGNVENWLADADGRGVPYATLADRRKFGLLGAIRTDASINDFITGRALGPMGQIKLGTKFMLGVPSSAINSIEPTRAELEDSGGLANYYARGGFLLYKPTFDGSEPIRQQSLRYNVAYFKCTDGKLAVWTEKVPDEGHGWLAFVTFGSSYKIRVQMKDRSTWESVKKAVGAALSKSFEYMCKAAPLAQGVAQIAASSKTCTRTPPTNATAAQKQAAGCTPLEIAASAGTTPFLACQEKLKACKEGEPGCNCAPPQIQSKEQLAIAAGAQFLNAVCNLPSDAEPVISCDQLDQPSGSKWWLWALAAFGVGGGIWAASRR